MDSREAATKSFHEFSVEQVRNQMVATGQLRPSVKVILSTGHVLNFDYAGDDAELAKARKMICMGITAARVAGRLKFASFTSEAWVSRRSAENPLPKLRASEDPDKKEGVFCITWEGDQRTAHFFDIKRDKKGRPELSATHQNYEDLEMWIDKAFLPIPVIMPEEIQRDSIALLDRLFPPK